MLLVGLVTFLLQVTTFFIFFNQMVLPNVRVQVGEFVDQLEAVAATPQLLDTESAFIAPPDELQLQPASWRIPFWHFVEEVLEQRLGQPVPMWEEQGRQLGGGHYWVDLPREQAQPLRIGFSADREGCLNPPVLLMVLFLVVSISVISVYFLSRWLVRPIEELHLAVGELGMGEYPEPLPERGPTELSSLVQLFNWMVKSVRSLTENRSTLLAGISHDLKTPLARMRLSVEMIRSEKDRDLLDGIVEDLDVMDGMISESLKFARGERKGEQQEVDLNAFISTIVERRRRGTMALQWTPQQQPCIASIDPTALQRILSNYLDNGVRYGGGAPVEVRLQCEPHSVRIEVLDRGAGIAEEELEKVFRPFYRADRSRSQSGGGNGLGLAIVQNLAISCGWAVSLANRPDGGAVAAVEVPL
jgi:two-component system osmolarity sensor histidine kinase EnvZ